MCVHGLALVVVGSNGWGHSIATTTGATSIVGEFWQQRLLLTVEREVVTIVPHRVAACFTSPHRISSGRAGALTVPASYRFEPEALVKSWCRRNVEEDERAPGPMALRAEIGNRQTVIQGIQEVAINAIAVRFFVTGRCCRND